MYNGLKITGEIIFMLLRMIFAYFQALYIVIFPAPEDSVSGDIVLVTGTGHGIGKELARQYATLGATVVCVDVNEQTNKETAKEIQSSGGRAFAFQCDVTSRDKVLQLRDQIKREIGTVTVLVNNAGIMPCQPLDRQSPEIIHKQFDVNVFAHFWTLEAFLPDMNKEGRGSIVALSSVAGLTGQPNLVPYCATKFAVRGMMEALREEYRAIGSPLKFTTIYPYMTDTGLCKKPRLRFPELFQLLPPSAVAADIISAQRRGIREKSVPTYMLHLNNSLRSIPMDAAMKFVDFIDSGLDPHDD